MTGFLVGDPFSGSSIMIHRLISTVAVALLVPAQPATALEPRDVALLVNQNEPKSAEVAEHYRQARNIPRENVIRLDVPISEEMTRAEYDQKLVLPLRQALRRWPRPAKVLVSIYGIPLRVGPVESSKLELDELEKLKPQLQMARHEMERKQRLYRMAEEDAAKDKDSPLRDTVAKYREEATEARNKVHELEEREKKLRHVDSVASVDSELMQLWWPEYPKVRWVINPLNRRVPDAVRKRFPPTLMTARLDGPDVAIVKRMIDDAVAAEAVGLKGKVYVDARGMTWDQNTDPTGTGYGGYDLSMREMADLLLAGANLPVTLDNAEPLFPPHGCPDAALYCGWYSVRNYVPCCQFVPGAVAWHLASYEAVSIRRPDRQWCGNLLRDGAAVTLGAVAEPFTIGFPKPVEFFGLLVTGEMPLVEVYANTLILSSWQMTLVGDPLYTPFARRPALKSRLVPFSPLGSRYVIE